MAAAATSCQSRSSCIHSFSVRIRCRAATEICVYKTIYGVLRTMNSGLPRVKTNSGMGVHTIMLTGLGTTHTHTHTHAPTCTHAHIHTSKTNYHYLPCLAGILNCTICTQLSSLTIKRYANVSLPEILKQKRMDLRTEKYNLMLFQ